MKPHLEDPVIGSNGPRLVAVHAGDGSSAKKIWTNFTPRWADPEEKSGGLPNSETGMKLKPSSSGLMLTIDT